MGSVSTCCWSTQFTFIFANFSHFRASVLGMLGKGFLMLSSSFLRVMPRAFTGQLSLRVVFYSYQKYEQRSNGEWPGYRGRWPLLA